MPLDHKIEYRRYQRYYHEVAQKIEKPKNRRYTSAIFSFLAISLFWWYAIRPTIQTILFLQREIKDNQLVNQKMEEKISALVEAQATYQTIELHLPIVDQVLPVAPDVIAVVSQIRNLADVTTASVSSVQVPSVPLLGFDASQSAKTVSTSTGKAPATIASPRPNDYPIVVIVNGPWPALREFLLGLLSMRRIATVESVGIGPSKERAPQSAGKPLQMNVRLKTYYLFE